MNSERNILMLACAGILIAGGIIYATKGNSPEPGEGAAVASATTENASEGSTDVGSGPTRPAISVATVGKAVLKDRIRASGLVSAVERVLVQPKIEGQPIDEIDAEVGDHVEAGAVLAQLSDTALKLQRSQLLASRASALAMIAQAEAQLTEAQAAAKEAERTKARAAQLQKNGNASQAASDQATTAATSAAARVLVATQGAEAAKAQLELVDAQLNNIDLQLSRTKITAPFAGEIVERNAVAGGIASAAGQPMFVLVRDGLLELNADVAEQDLPRIAAGMTVTLRAAGSDTTFTGTVRLVEPAIDLTTRLGRARISINQADRVRTGMFLEAEIAVSENEVIAVPITAVGTDADGTFLMTVDDKGQVHRKPVKTGVRDGGKVQIVEGVNDGEQVVAKAASFVRDGDLVNPVSADAAKTN